MGQVRPVGCFDCRDYQDLGVTCSLGFVESTEEITVGKLPRNRNGPCWGHSHEVGLHPYLGIP